jgi:hypothetical protein
MSAVAHARLTKTEDKKQVLDHPWNIMPLGMCTGPGQLLRPVC